MSLVIRNSADLDKVKAEYNENKSRYKHQILVCAGAGCISSSCLAVRDAAIAALAELKLSGEACVYETGCMGTCAVGPVMLILPERIFYTKLTPEITKAVIKAHLVEGKVLEEYTFFDTNLGEFVPKIDDIAFFKEQVRIVLRNCGAIEYNKLEAYIANDGYYAAAKVLTGMTPQQVVDEMKASGLRGRGGAGFPTGIKWEAGLKAQSEEKYLVCNADEGDPGAFMDRSVIEGDPHNLIEGMIIGGYAIGASKGFVYVRAEYPIAVERLEIALEQSRTAGLLGKNIFGTGFNFDLEIRIGAGAFVCGEETSLMASIEGQRGEPRQKPPFPFQKGLFGKPTIINNVETFANVAAIMLKGAAWYTQWGTEKAKGTKVFALAGDIVNTGIVEVPIGIPLGEIIYKIGGGVLGGKPFKSAQIGGPSGGCITKENLNVPTDYDSLIAAGAIMGSGGLIVMNEDTCMVDTARYFMDFIQEESCGKCVACRIGTKRMLEILERITKGEGEEGDIEKLEELGKVIQKTAMCGLGQTAPNPVLSTIRYFREEYEEHIKNKHCRAGVCADLLNSPCQNACPASINVPGYMSLIASNRFVDAYDLICQENPMPSVCGRVCTHPCESKCRRGTVDEAIAICDLKRYVADYAFKNKNTNSQIEAVAKNGKSVSVIGAGPSGLTCAYYLARLGYTVDVYEANSIAGGVLAYGIPEYRLPMDVLSREIEQMTKAGFEIHLNTEVGKDISFADLKKKSNAVFVAVGTQNPQKANVEGENLEGVLGGLNFLKDVKQYNKVDFTGKKVAVIGGGNTAIDSARTAKRLGAESVTILYRRNKETMPAEKFEIEEALEEGVVLMENVSPVAFKGVKGKLNKVELIKRAPSNFDKAGRRNTKEIEGSNFDFDVDVVITAVSQYADIPFAKDGGISVTPWGTFIVNPDTYMTTADGVFAGGDIIWGPLDAIHAIADGKQAAAEIDKYLGGEGVLNKGRSIDIPNVADEDEIVMHNRFGQDHVEADEREKSFIEVAKGYHKLNAVAEAMRCLHCDRR